MAGHLFASGIDFLEDPPLPWPRPILARPLPTPPSSLHQAHAAHHARLRQHLQRVPSFTDVRPFLIPSSPFLPSPPLSHPHRLPGYSFSSPSVTEQQQQQQAASRSDGHSLPWARGPSAASREGDQRQPPPPSRPNTFQTAAVLPSLSSVVGTALPASWDFSNLESPPRPSPHGDDYFPALLDPDFSSPSLPPASPFAYRSGAEPDNSFPRLPPQPAPVVASLPETSGPAASSDSTNPSSKRERTESEEVEIPPSSPLDAMPALRKRAAAPTVVESEGPAAKRPRGATTSARPRISSKRLKREDPIPLDTDLFGSSDDEKDETVEMVDLVDVNENDNVIDPTPKEDKSIRLSTFQCVICMDDVQDLTVTYCGHLFCSECLHSSLHIDATRKICPICRQKIELRKPNAKAGSRTYFPLELKLMTRNRIGKRPAR